MQQLYKQYGSTTGSIRLAQCERCQEFADKYVESDLVLIFIDMILLKPHAYRHLIFNRIKYNAYGISDGVVRFAILLNLFEVYMKWFQMEKAHHPMVISSHGLPVHLQYLYVLTICVFEFILVHFTIRNVTGIVLNQRLDLEQANHLSMALIMSSFGKILLIVMVIWDYGLVDPSFFINLFVMACNFVAIKINLKASFTSVTIILFYGLAVTLSARLMTGIATIL